MCIFPFLGRSSQPTTTLSRYFHSCCLPLNRVNFDFYLKLIDTNLVGKLSISLISIRVVCSRCVVFDFFIQPHTTQRTMAAALQLPKQRRRAFTGNILSYHRPTVIPQQPRFKWGIPISSLPVAGVCVVFYFYLAACRGLKGYGIGGPLLQISLIPVLSSTYPRNRQPSKWGYPVSSSPPFCSWYGWEDLKPG